MNFQQAKSLKFYDGGKPEELLTRARKGGLWRPTAVALAHHDKDFCFTIKKALRMDKEGFLEEFWKSDFLKGGVDNGEVVEEALLRECFEEGCLLEKYILDMVYIGWALVPFSRSNHGRDGYTKGKLYLFYKVSLSCRCVFPGQDRHNVSVKWVRDPVDFFTKKTKKGVLLSQKKLREICSY